MRLKITDWVIDFIIARLMQNAPPRKYPLSDFDRLRHEIRPGDVLLFEGRNRVSQVIKYVTQSAWSHAALYVGRLHDIENSRLREHLWHRYQGKESDQLIIESLLGKGTIVSPISKYQYDHIRICRPKGLSHGDVQHVIGYAIGKLGIEYDVRHVIDLMRYYLPWSILPRRWRSTLFRHSADNSVRVICSALLAEAFDSVKFPILPLIKIHESKGIELIPRNPRLFTPSDFDYSPFFEIIKYPIFDVSLSHRLYRNLPWTEEENRYSNDDEIDYINEVVEKPKE